jgi:hypothetical protein
MPAGVQKSVTPAHTARRIFSSESHLQANSSSHLLLFNVEAMDESLFFVHGNVTRSFG